MQAKLAAFLFLSSSPAVLHAQSLATVDFHGSGSDSANAITTDSAGNIYIAGTTTSFDLPLLNPAQPANSGTQLIFTSDAGLSWRPLGNLPNPDPSSLTQQTLSLAIDAANSNIVYAGFKGAIFKSTDGGHHFAPGVTLQPVVYQVLVLVVDPSNSANIYAGTDSGVFKSADAGATWNLASSGLLNLQPPHTVGSLVIDPFHPKSIWAVAGGVGFLSTDGANSWTQLSLPAPAAGNASIFEFAFDAVTPGVVYAFGSQPPASYLLKSTDGGASWSQLNIPFTGGILVTDPVRAGRLYAIGSSGAPSSTFYRSLDAGATWQSFPFPDPLAQSLAVDPANPNILLAGMYRSADGGQTWSLTTVSREVLATFAPSGKGTAVAAAPISSDVFVAKFAPDGNTLKFATYFGGMGNETASGIQVDKSGNVWIAGSTNSVDLPVSKNAFEQHLKGVTNTFLAEFTSDGRLLASTYLGGSGTDSIRSLRLDPHGDPWIFGQTDSPDFPLQKGGPPPLQPGANYLFLAKVSATASHILYSTSIDNASVPGGMTIDAEGDILLTGATNSPDFPLTPDFVHGVAPPGLAREDAFLIKLDSTGNTIFSTYLGGSVAAPVQIGGFSDGGGLDNFGVAVTTDSTGIYITGQTSALDFPASKGAFQKALKAGCAYPSFEVDTGLIGTISTFLVDDVFVMKLSPDGKTLLYSTMLGGSCFDRPTDIAVAPTGAVFVTGETNSVDFPVVHPFLPAPAIMNYESFVSMLSPDGSVLPFSTYLLAGNAPSLALGPDGSPHIAGRTGFRAQTMTFSGFLSGPTVPITQTYLAALDLSGNPPPLNLTGVLNAFSLLPGPIAPGEIIQLSVPDFIPPRTLSVGLNELLPLSTTLGGVQVLFDGQPVPVVTISRGKIVCIAPQNLTTNASVTIQVSVNGPLSNPLLVFTAPVALGLLSADGSGTGLANARNRDGKLNSPAHPAKRGTTVTIFFTGAAMPPSNFAIYLSNGAAQPVTISPLRGFVPGIYAAYFEAPTDSANSSPLSVMLYENGSQSQTLAVYIE